MGKLFAVIEREFMERVRSISPDGGTDLEPALWLSMNMLANVTAARKRVVSTCSILVFCWS